MFIKDVNVCVRVYMCVCVCVFCILTRGFNSQELRLNKLHGQL